MTYINEHMIYKWYEIYRGHAVHSVSEIIDEQLILAKMLKEIESDSYVTCQLNMANVCLPIIIIIIIIIII